MSQLGMMAVLAAMSGVVATALVWFSSALFDNLRTLRARRAAGEIATDDDAED